jgi:serine/threonine protein kinase
MTSFQLSKRDNWRFRSVLGKGSQGQIYHVKMKEDQKEYALKVFSFNDVSDPTEKKNLLERAKNEFLLLNGNLENVVKSIGCFLNDAEDEFIFSMKLYKTNLKKICFDHQRERKRPFEYEELIKIFGDIVRG